MRIWIAALLLAVAGPAAAQGVSFDLPRPVVSALATQFSVGAGYGARCGLLAPMPLQALATVRRIEFANFAAQIRPDQAEPVFAALLADADRLVAGMPACDSAEAKGDLATAVRAMADRAYVDVVLLAGAVAADPASRGLTRLRGLAAARATAPRWAQVYAAQATPRFGAAVVAAQRDAARENAAALIRLTCRGFAARPARCPVLAPGEVPLAAALVPAVRELDAFMAAMPAGAPAFVLRGDAPPAPAPAPGAAS